MDYSQIFSSTDSFSAFLNDPKIQVLLVILAIWALIWKGFALWRAAKNNSRNWFIALLILNTFGILEIIYLFYFSKPKVNKNLPVK